MADQNAPNDASQKSKAEGERWKADDSHAASDQQAAATGQQGGGITNRPLSEEAENQAELPERGTSQPGAHAGHGGGDRGERRSER